MIRKRTLAPVIVSQVLWLNGCSAFVSHHRIGLGEVSDHGEIRVATVRGCYSEACEERKIDEDTVWTNIIDSRLEGDSIKGISPRGFDLAISASEVHGIEQVARGDPTDAIIIGIAVLVGFLVASECDTSDGEPDGECSE